MRSANKVHAYVVVACFVAFMCAVPWDTLAGGFIDKDVYKNYFLNEQSVLEYRDFDSPVDFVTNEFLWHLTVGYLVDSLGVDIENVFLGISAFCLVCFSLLITSRVSVYSIFFLINPLVVDLAFSQFRSALAVSLLLVAYLSRRWLIVALAFVLCSLIHTATLIFFSVFFASYFISLQKSGWVYRNRVFLLFLIGFGIAILLGPMREGVLNAVGDRRAEYSDMSSSVQYMLYWAVLAALFYRQSNKVWFSEPEHCYAFVVLSLVLSNIFLAGYSLRFLGASFPFIVIGIMRSRRPESQVSAVLLLLYATFQWAYWIKPNFLFSS